MNCEKIPFYKPFSEPTAGEYLKDVFSESNSFFRGKYHQLCYDLIKQKYNCDELVLTSSCTDALTMATLTLDLKQGDEVIIPAFTFPSVANVFANRGIGLKMADSQSDHPNMDPDSFRSLIGPRTKAVVFMSYGGQSTGIEQIIQIAKEKEIYVIEDAAHSYNCLHGKKYTGTFGDVATFSFHETKAVSCGQGGMLLINNPALVARVKSIRDHGTNRWQVLEGLASEYNWTSLGGEFNLPELSAAYLYSQLNGENQARNRRKELWNYYYSGLLSFSKDHFLLPRLYNEDFNFYIFYLLVNNKAERNALIAFLKHHQIHTAFHYAGLHRSDYFCKHNAKVHLPNADRFSHCLLRLPLYPQLSVKEIERICFLIEKFYTTAYENTMV
jgi:dTDP-4-amino-4,6-dideoxygalactose transaminase